MAGRRASSTRGAYRRIDQFMAGIVPTIASSVLYCLQTLFYPPEKLCNHATE